MYTEHGTKSNTLGKIQMLMMCCIKSCTSQKKKNSINEQLFMACRQQQGKTIQTQSNEHIWPPRTTVLSLWKMDTLPIFHKKCSVKFNNKCWRTLK